LHKIVAIRKTLGGSLALLSRVVAERHPDLRFQSFDLPPVETHARKAIDAAGSSDRIGVVTGDFFTDPLPKADVVMMSNILHDWNLEKKMHLIRNAHEAVSDGGGERLKGEL